MEETKESEIFDEDEYLEDWREWMNAPLGVPEADQAHLDSIKADNV